MKEEVLLGLEERGEREKCLNNDSNPNMRGENHPLALPPLSLRVSFTLNLADLNPPSTNPPPHFPGVIGEFSPVSGSVLEIYYRSVYSET